MNADLTFRDTPGKSFEDMLDEYENDRFTVDNAERALKHFVQEKVISLLQEFDFSDSPYRFSGYDFSIEFYKATEDSIGVRINTVRLENGQEIPNHSFIAKEGTFRNEGEITWIQDFEAALASKLGLINHKILVYIDPKYIREGNI